MEPLKKYTETSILKEDVFVEIFSQEDEITKARIILSLEERADELKVGKQFRKLLKAYKKVAEEKPRKTVGTLENWTNFGAPYDNMKCRSWIATPNGIYQQSTNPFAPDILACYHPILPIERLKNLETGDEQLKLAFKRSGRWEEIIVAKTTVTSAAKIVSLSAKGVAVTSENAKHLVRFLSDVENLNDDAIEVQYSTSKLGWIKDGFVPYNTEIVFDGDTRFRQIYDSVSTCGSREVWMRHIKKLRTSGRMEIKLMLAASFASVLVSLLGGLPFILDLWGETEGGKTVTLMLATSVWADPAESKYIGDFKTTDTALEARADMLNHLPLIMDDTSKVSNRIRDNFEGMVYDLCSGKGKSRSNKDLGVNRENRWRNCILTSGERALQTYVSQGGAINRILEIECGEHVYQNPHETAETIKANYGFAGKEFVQIVSDMGKDAVREIQEGILQQLMDDNKMQKQAMALSIVLTADKIATECIFGDGQYISMDDARNVLADRSELSDGERAYRYICDKVGMNPSRFDDTANCEKWGVLDGDNAYFFTQAFDELCRAGGFSRKGIVSWLEKKKLIECDRGHFTKLKRINGKRARCVCVRVEREEEAPVDEAPEWMPVPTQRQEELPFV